MVFRTLSFTTSSGDSHSTRALLYRVLTCEPRTSLNLPAHPPTIIGYAPQLEGWRRSEGRRRLLL